MPKTVSDFKKAAGLNSLSDNYLEQALTHSSRTFEEGLAKSASNERLEFLGDAVLELCISEMLFNHPGNLGEGSMTKVRSLLSREESLVELAQKLDLGSYLRMGKGEENSGGRDKPSNLADAMEAVIAAIYLDQGYAACVHWLKQHFSGLLEDALEGKLNYDYKSSLQELVQAFEHKQNLEYKIVGESGPDHAKTFSCQLLLDGKHLSSGEGRNKKQAEQEAAKAALCILQKKS